MKESRESSKDENTNLFAKQDDEIVSKDDHNQNNSTEALRTAILFLMGHVDTGKTKLLDTIRKIHPEGIKVQFNSIDVPIDSIREKMLQYKELEELQMPHLIMLDNRNMSPFHLNNKNVQISDLVVLVADIAFGIESITEDILKMLKLRKIPFVIVLNKIDRLYNWQNHPNLSFSQSLEQQNKETRLLFEERLQFFITSLEKDFSLKSALYYNIKDEEHVIPIIPTSAYTGEGITDLLFVILKSFQGDLRKSIIKKNEFEATVLSVRNSQGERKILDVIIRNGQLNKKDKLVLQGFNEPIVTNVLNILIQDNPQMINQQYKKLDCIKDTKLIMIETIGKNLNEIVIGSPLVVVHNEKQLKEATELIQHQMNEHQKIQVSEHGIYLKSSTQGCLEMIIEHLKLINVPISAVSLGPVSKKDVVKASLMHEKDHSKYALVLAYDVGIDQSARESSESLKVPIFSVDVIFQMEDILKNYFDKFEIFNQPDKTVFPCILEILPDFIFHLKNPIVVGVLVKEGELKVGTPLCIPSKEVHDLGFVSKITLDNEELDSAKEGQRVAVLISPHPLSTVSYCYNRHFNHQDLLISKITRESLDIMKLKHREEAIKWFKLLKKLKEILKIL